MRGFFLFSQLLLGAGWVWMHGQQGEVWDLRNNLTSIPLAIPPVFPSPGPTRSPQALPPCLDLLAVWVRGAQAPRGNPEPQHL